SHSGRRSRRHWAQCFWGVNWRDTRRRVPNFACGVATDFPVARASRVLAKASSPSRTSPKKIVSARRRNQHARRARPGSLLPGKETAAWDDSAGRLARLKKRLLATPVASKRGRAKGEGIKISTLSFKYGTC